MMNETAQAMGGDACGAVSTVVRKSVGSTTYEWFWWLSYAFLLTLVRYCAGALPVLAFVWRSVGRSGRSQMRR